MFRSYSDFSQDRDLLGRLVPRGNVQDKIPVGSTVQNLQDPLPGKVRAVADFAQVAEHDRAGGMLASGQRAAQQPAAFLIAQVIMGSGIGKSPEELRVVVGLHVDEIGVLKFRGDAVPFTEIRCGYDLPLSPVLPDGDLKSEGVADPVVGHAEGVNGEVADLKWAFVIRPEFQIQERRFPKVPA